MTTYDLRDIQEQTFDPVALAKRVIGVDGLVPGAYDYVSLTSGTYGPTVVVFKSGGAGGTVIATLTLAYDGSGNLTSVTKT